MLTRFITSQQDHDGCLCTGINILPNLRVDISLPPPLLSRGRLRLVKSGQRHYSSQRSIPLPLRLSPHSPTSLAFNKMDYTNGNRVSSSERSEVLIRFN